MALPVAPIRRSKLLAGHRNGELPDSVLVDVPGQDGGPTVRLIAPAARSWVALCAAPKPAGHILKAAGVYDSYRPLSVQTRIFEQRYTTKLLARRPTKTWKGRTYYLKPGNATAASPGTSNHGWAGAVDTGVERDGDPTAESIDRAALDWLLSHAHEFGWSWELQDEPWHLHYFAGDDIPAAVNAHPAPEEDDMYDQPDRNRAIAQEQKLNALDAKVATLQNTATAIEQKLNQLLAKAGE